MLRRARHGGCDSVERQQTFRAELALRAMTAAPMPNNIPARPAAMTTLKGRWTRIKDSPHHVVAGGVGFEEFPKTRYCDVSAMSFSIWMPRDSRWENSHAP